MHVTRNNLEESIYADSIAPMLVGLGVTLLACRAKT
jgi:hypothetical protein